MSQQKEEPRRDSPYWSLDMRINVGHLLTTAVMAASVFAWGNSMDRRVAVLEEKAQAQLVTDTKQDQAAQAAVLLLRADLAGMRAESVETNRKLDRLIEARMGRRDAAAR